MAKLFTKEGENYNEVEAFLQEDVDKIVKDRAERIARQQFPDYAELKEKAGKVDTLTSEWETKLTEATGKVDTLTKDLGTAKLETEKVKIIHEFKLNDDLAEFVQGDSADDMRKRAEKLAKGIPGGKINIDKKPKPEDGKNTDTKAIAGKLFGRKSD